MVAKKETFSMNVPAAGEGQRVDKWLVEHLPQLVTRSQLQKWIDDHRVAINGKICKANQKLDKDDVVTVASPPIEQTTRVLRAISMPLEILFEDEQVLVIDKPAGIAVHPGAGDPEPTLVEGLLAYRKDWQQSLQDQEGFRPGVVHRLDKDTTGVMVFAKTPVAYQDLTQQFREKTNARQYIAILDGLLPHSPLTYESYLYRDPNHRLRFASISAEEIKKQFAQEIPSAYRWAKSLFQVQGVFAHHFTLAEVTLHTGRTHQIRVHSQALHAPVLGDPLYAHKRIYPKTLGTEVLSAFSQIRRQLLHAQTLGFMHPISKEVMSFVAKVPADFQKILTLLDRYRIEA